MSLRIITGIAIAALLSGCAQSRLQPVSSQAVEPDGTMVPRVDVLMVEKLDQTAADESQEPAPQPTLYKGNNRMVKLPKATAPLKLVGESVSINFEQAPLSEVVHAILGDMLKLDYVVEHPISGEVTVRTRTPVPRDQLLVILESLLQSNGAVMVRDKTDKIYVSGTGRLTQTIPTLSSARSKGAGYTTTVIPLQYIGAAEMADILKPVASEAAFVRVDPIRNLLILAGTRSQIEGWMEMVSTFDIDVLGGMSVGVFPLQNYSVEDMDAALKEILGQGAEGTANALLGDVVKVMPVARLNSMLVITPRAHYLNKVGMWIERLDNMPDNSAERRLHVYPVQNATSGHLAQLLSSVFSGSGSSSAPASSSGVAPGLKEETVSADGKSVEVKKNSSSQQTSPTSVTLGGGVNVVADEENNALLIYASGKEYKKIAKALEQLDVTPAQVLIEASILEVTLTDGFEFGLEWAFSGRARDGYSGSGQLGVNKTPFSRAVPGFSYALANAAGDIKAVLNMLAEKSLINVISTPSVMVLDNHTASIQVGDQQPVRTNQSVNSDGNVLTTSIEYKDTGVSLSVTPSVNAGGLVTMDVEQNVTDVGAADSVTGQRSFRKRDISSRVAVRSGEAVVLGGLIRENKTNSKSGVPGLYEVPLLGNLFGKTTDSGVRTELLVVITPKVLFNESDLREVSQEMRSRMRGFTLIKPSAENKSAAP